ncbi:hypothetical protein M3Y99_00081500 [Aphelenchoides fujianensis]|nr:hypothetical protein M3Y99_00081500 [Aphelenchoides fujianensis]
MFRAELDVIAALLQVEPQKRLGYSNITALKEHVWFSSLSFEEILAGRVKAPIIPTVFHEGDCGNFDSYNELEKRPPAKQRDLDLFDDW